MEVKIKVPFWVNTDNEGVICLFGFLRKVAIKHNIDNEAIDMYGYDLRRILDQEADELHEWITDHVDPAYCQVAKLNRDHFMFKVSHLQRDCKVVKISSERQVLIWAYLLGCSNNNLLEERQNAFILDRPHYNVMPRNERELFHYSTRSYVGKS